MFLLSWGLILVDFKLQCFLLQCYTSNICKVLVN